MPFQVSAGLNITEKDGTTGIPNVGTSESAFAGHFSWGPVQKRILIDSESNLHRTFFGPNANNATDWFSAAQYLAYTGALQTVRVVNANTSGGNLGDQHARNAHGNSANGKNTIIKNSDDYNDNYSTGISGVGNWVAKYPGELGNSLRVSVCPTTNAYSRTLTGTLDFTSNSTAVTGIATSFTTQVAVGDILLAGPDRVEVKVASIGNTTSIVLQSKYTGNTVTGQTSVTRKWEFHNSFDGAPGTSAFASVAGGSLDEMHIVVVDEDGRFTGVANNVLERFAKVSKASDAKTTDGATNYYKNVINDQSQYIWWASNLTGATSVGNRAAGTNFGLGSQQAAINASLVLGRDGATPQESEYIKGYGKFVNPEEVDIGIVIGGAAGQTRALYILNNIVETRKDCVATLSPRRSDVVNNSSYVNKEAEDMVTYRNLLPSTSYGVLDGGWKYIYDKYNDVYRYVPTSGDTAGLMARTDREFDPWYSPAGYNRGQIKNVVKLAFNPNKAARDLMYKNGINPVVTFPGEGTILYGDKTLLARPSAFDRINVRRLFITMEKQIAIAAKYALFEFNDEFTRASFRNLVEPYLRDVQGRRGIYDFRVVCDTTNNTPEVIDRNEFIGDIYVKPARSINFVQLNFVATRTGVDFSEIVGQI